jgi:hypothetical protein
VLRRSAFPVLHMRGVATSEEMQHWPRSVPLTLVEPWRKAIEANHRRTLEQLAKSGGLTPQELWLAAHGKTPDDADEVTVHVAARWLIAELNKDAQ